MLMTELLTEPYHWFTLTQKHRVKSTDGISIVSPAQFLTSLSLLVKV